MANISSFKIILRQCLNAEEHANSNAIWREVCNSSMISYCKIGGVLEFPPKCKWLRRESAGLGTHTSHIIIDMLLCSLIYRLNLNLFTNSM